MSKLWKWFKRYWKYILIVPAIAIGAFCAVRWIILLFTDTEKPNLTDLERDLRSDMDRIDDKEREMLGLVNDEERKLKDGIDRGDPSAAEVFNREIDSNDDS